MCRRSMCGARPRCRLQGMVFPVPDRRDRGEGHEKGTRGSSATSRGPSASASYHVAELTTACRRCCRRRWRWHDGMRRTDPKGWTVFDLPTTPRCCINRWIELVRPRFTSIITKRALSTILGRRRARLVTGPDRRAHDDRLRARRRYLGGLVPSRAASEQSRDDLAGSSFVDVSCCTA